MNFTPLAADLELLAADQLDMNLTTVAPTAAATAEGFEDVDMMLDYLIADGQHASLPAGSTGEQLVIGDVPTLELIFDTSRLERELESSAYSSSDAASSPTSRDDADADPDAEADDDSDEMEHKAQERKARRRQQVATSSRRHRTRKKNEMIELRKQVEDLSSELEALRSMHKIKHRDGGEDWQERAITQRHKRRQTEELNQQLRHALLAQRGLVKDLKNVFSISPVHNLEVNMRYLMHSYTRLGTDSQSRARENTRLYADSKLDLTMDILTRETAAITFDTPSITTRQIQAESNEIGMTTVAVYALDTHDVNKIFTSACNAILSCGSEWPNYSLVDQHTEAVQSTEGHAQYRISDSTYRNTSTGKEIRLASRGISYHRITDKYAVMLWDYVDVDELHPVKNETQMKRDVIGGVLVRREKCADDVERVVCRKICTKMYSQIKPLVSDENRTHYSQFTLSQARDCGCRVFNHIKEAGACQASI